MYLCVLQRNVHMFVAFLKQLLEVYHIVFFYSVRFVALLTILGIFGEINIERLRLKKHFLNCSKMQ